MAAANKIQVGYIEPQDGAQFKVDEGTAAAPGICFVDSAATGLYSPGTGQLAFSTSSKQTALRILADGKVGIDCSPTVALEVNGTIKASAIDAPIEGTLDDWIVHAGDTNTKIGFSANDTFQVHTSGTPSLQLDSTGRVLIGNAGTYSASGDLHVVGDTNSNGPELYLQVNNNNTTDNIGAIWYGNNVDKSLVKLAGHTHTANNTADFTVSTSSGGTLGERLRIKSDGTSLFTGKITNSSSFTSHNTNFYGGNVNTGGVRIEVAHSTTSVSGNTASASFPHHLLLSNYSGTGSADNRMCSIGFDIPTTSTHANAVIAYQATAAGTGDLQFHLESGNSISEKLRITSAGKLQIGTAGGNATYLALAGNAAMDLWGDGSEYPTLRLGTEVYNSVGEDIRFGRSDHGAADIRYHSLKSLHGSSAANNYLEFFLHDFGSSPYTSQKSAFKINGLGNAIIPDGDLVIGTSGHGIDFSATGGGSGTSNESELLADYENGEWTPVLHHYISGGFSAPSYSAAGTVVGRYTKIGNIVHISASFLGFNISNAHGSSFGRVTGLPFTTTNHPNHRDVISASGDAFTTGGVNFSTYWNQTNLNSMKHGTSVFDWAVLSGGSTKNLVISGHYTAA